MINISVSNNATTPSTLTSSIELDTPSSDEEPGSTSPKLLHRLSKLMNSNEIIFYLAILITLYWLPSVTATATPTSTRLVESQISDVGKLQLGWTSLLKRATTESAAAASTCACKVDEGTKHDAAFIAKACVIPLLVLTSGATAGLTLGLMSLDTTQLQVLMRSGSPQQKMWASKVLPVRKNGHLLLITLLIANMLLNEILPVLSESVMGGGLVAVAASTVMIVIFAEIIPQSVCSRFGLRIGAAMVIPVRILIAIFFVVAWPAAKLLELILGPHDGIVYRRAELKELVALHAQSAGQHGDLETDTVAIVGATLDLQSKTVRDAMTPVSSLFSLPITAKLDYETLGKILKAGHSRIPVYEDTPIESKGEKKNQRKIIGVLLTKQLILLDPEDAIPLHEIPINPLPLVSDDLPLLQILNTFQEGRSHMAIVCRRKFSPASAPTPLETIPSVDSTVNSDLERGEGSKNGSSEGFIRGLFRRKRSRSDSSDSSSTRTRKKILEEKGEKPSLSTLNLAELDEEFPQGIITLEDVLEELIGEEILDETDGDDTHLPSMTYYIPPEARGKVGNLGPPPAPSAHLAQQARQNSSTTKGGIVGVVGRGFGMGRSRSAPGQKRSGDKSGSSSGTTTPKEETGGNKFMGDGTPVTGSNGSGLGGLVGGAFGRGNAGKRRSSSPSRTSSIPTTPGSNPRSIDFAAQPSSTPVASFTGQAQVEEPQSLDAIDESTSVKPTSSSSHPPLTIRQPVATVPSSALPSPSLLSDAVYLERGRRMLIAKGSDPNQLSLANLRLAGLTRSQPGSRSATPTPSTPTTGSTRSPHSASPPNTERSASGSRTKGIAFKSPASLSALPQVSKVPIQKEKSAEGRGGVIEGSKAEKERKEEE